MTDPAGPLATARSDRSPTHEMSRRGLLGAGVAVLGALVGGAGGVALTAPRRRTVPDPVLPADVVAAVAREQDLIAGYDALLGTLPVPDPRLRGIRDEHQSHLEALTALLPAPTRPPGGPTGSANSPADPTPATTLADLQAAEAAAAAAAHSACLAGNGTAAVLLACIAASEASHAAVLA